MIVEQVATTLMPGATVSFGRPADDISYGIITSTESSHIPLLSSHQAENYDRMSIGQQSQGQQLIAPDGSSYSSEVTFWTPAECTALFQALIASFSVILVSELGDKTFIITAIMAMKNSRSLVFLASAMALFLMTVLSVGMGVAVTVIPEIYTHYASIVLFLGFGLKMLKEAYEMDADDSEEFDEVERSLGDQSKDQSKEDKDPQKIPIICEEQVEGQQKSSGESDKTAKDGLKTASSGLLSKLTKTIYVAPILIKVFTMILVAEWGDRSQISTVILAAREDVVGVFVGSFLGHVLCTGLAVIGGRIVADMISVRTMTLLGGIIFLFFAAFAILSRIDTDLESLRVLVLRWMHGN